MSEFFEYEIVREEPKLPPVKFVRVALRAHDIGIIANALANVYPGLINAKGGSTTGFFNRLKEEISNG